MAAHGGRSHLRTVPRWYSSNLDRGLNVFRRFGVAQVFGRRGGMQRYTLAEIGLLPSCGTAMICE